jgi:hypothetical protein
MSGYTGSIFRRDGHSEPQPHFVEKPFRVDDLLRKVRAMLDAPG